MSYSTHYVNEIVCMHTASSYTFLVHSKMIDDGVLKCAYKVTFYLMCSQVTTCDGFCCFVQKHLELIYHSLLKTRVNFMYRIEGSGREEGEGKRRGGRELTSSALVQKTSCAAEFPGWVMADRADATIGPTAAKQTILN